MITITKDKERKLLLLKYTTTRSFHDLEWVFYNLGEKDNFKIRRVFTFIREDIFNNIKSQDDDIFLILGNKEQNYYKIKARILGLTHDLHLSEDMEITSKTFIAHRDISIFRRINELVSEPIHVGGEAENAIPIEEFKLLLSRFPTTTEVTHYARSRISMILKDYLETMTDAQTKLQNYLKKKPLSHATDKESIESLNEYEIQKYEYIYDRILEALENERPYSERDWQNLILKFIMLIFPKYIAALHDVHLKDFYSKKDKPTDRYVDIALVDANWNIDIIEIKKPFKDCLLSARSYRGNFIPRKELAGAVMQAEKYIFHLNKWGFAGETAITEKHANDLPTGVKVRIINPKALIILGRSKGLTDKQIFDLELIRRKYANIMEIITYDDLLDRLNNIIQRFKNASSS